jgi:hypothetical protein
MRILLLILLFLTVPAFAQMVEVKENNQTQPSGREKAQGYFKERQGSKDDKPGATPRYLALHLGGFFSSQAYKWGDGDGDDPGKFNMGVTYRLGEWVNSMDLALRIDYTSYRLQEEVDAASGASVDKDARKLSLGVVVTFPDANSRFPLYFGGGLGPGFMMKQLRDESAIVIDYSLIAGARFLDVFNNVGFMVETGIKNHLHLIGSGQFNGVFLNVGTVFAF